MRGDYYLISAGVMVLVSWLMSRLSLTLLPACTRRQTLTLGLPSVELRPKVCGWLF